MVSDGKLRVWENIKIGDASYMISIAKNNGSFEIYLTNLVELWTEVLTRDSILQKLRKLNALLNIEMLDPDEVVMKLLNNISEHITEATVEEMKLRTKIGGGFLKFHLNLAKASPQKFYEVVTKPLCFSSAELLRQREILIDVIKKKDEEIAEYKAEGAELIRKNIETRTFKEDQINVDLPSVNNLNYESMFQTTIRFYNTLKPDRLREINDDSSVQRVSDRRETEEAETAGSTSSKSEESKNAGGDNNSVKTEGKKTPQKKDNTRVVYEPPKRRKKAQNNFLL